MADPRIEQLECDGEALMSERDVALARVADLERDLAEACALAQAPCTDCPWRARVAELEAALGARDVHRSPDAVREPIPMVLHCPECKARHIDEGDFATKAHHTHSCQGCGLTWRPAVVPTVGVQFLPGFKNEPVARPDGPPLEAHQIDVIEYEQRTGQAVVATDFPVGKRVTIGSEALVEYRHRCGKIIDVHMGEVQVQVDNVARPRWFLEKDVYLLPPCPTQATVDPEPTDRAKTIALWLSEFSHRVYARQIDFTDIEDLATRLSPCPTKPVVSTTDLERATAWCQEGCVRGDVPSRLDDCEDCHRALADEFAKVRAEEAQRHLRSDYARIDDYGPRSLYTMALVWNDAHGKSRTPGETEGLARVLSEAYAMGRAAQRAETAERGETMNTKKRGSE